MWDDHEMHKEVRNKGEGSRGRSTYQGILSFSIVINPSGIPSYTVQKHIYQLSEL